MAVFNVTPDCRHPLQQGECFCFTEQGLKPGQSLDMAVSFFVDRLLHVEETKDLAELTLSYALPVRRRRRSRKATPKRKHGPGR